MLTEQQKYDNKMKYLELVSKLGFDMTNFIKYLDGNEYFDQPANSQYFKVYPGGLVEYQLALYNQLYKFIMSNPKYSSVYTEADVIKVTLFKDFYRGFMYEPGAGRTLDNGQQVPTYRTIDANKRVTYGDIGLSSFMMARHFVEFTDEQALCIIHAKGDNYTPDIHEILHTYKLLPLLRMADLAIQNLSDEE